jgi:hypothetical protein
MSAAPPSLSHQLIKELHMRTRLHSERKFDARLSGSYRHCFMDSAPPPDPRMGQAAESMAANSAEQLAFAKQVYEEGKPRQAEMDRLSKAVTEQQIRIGDANEGRASQAWDRYNKTFVPIEDQFAAEAATAGGEADQELAAGRAAADVVSAKAANDEALTRDLTSMGVNPNAGKFVAIKRAGDVMDTASVAGAKTNARVGAKTQGIMLRQNTANLGRGLPAISAAQDGLSLGAGGAAGQSAGMGNNLFLQRGAQMQGGYSAAQQGLSDVYDAYNSQYQTQVGAVNAKNQAKGQIVGAGVGLGIAKSDRRLKSNIVRVGEDPRGFGLYEFEYRSEPGVRYFGAMVDEVEPVMPDAVAYDGDGYGAINYSLLGIDFRRID